jgi:GC-rich sequence DNA-binding factor
MVYDTDQNCPLFDSTVPDPTPIPTLSPAIARLTTSLTQLTTSHATSTATLSALAQERLALEAREKELRTAVEQAEEKRAWFDAFREWVEGVAVFMDEKVGGLLVPGLSACV